MFGHQPWNSSISYKEFSTCYIIKTGICSPLIDYFIQLTWKSSYLDTGSEDISKKTNNSQQATTKTNYFELNSSTFLLVLVLGYEAGIVQSKTNIVTNLWWGLTLNLVISIRHSQNLESIWDNFCKRRFLKNSLYGQQIFLVLLLNN